MNKENLKTTSAPSVIWRLPLTPIEKILLFNLAYLERDGKVTNKPQTLFKYIAGTTIDSVKRCFNNMEKNGWITRTKASAQSDIYTINWEMILKETKESDWYEYDDKTADLSHSNSKDVEMYHQELEESTDRIKMGKEEEMIETLLSDEELVEYVANKFIETEGDEGYNMFIKLNSTNPKSDEFRVLSNKWKHKCERYITTEERARLADRIIDIVWRRYYQRYKKEVA